MGASRLEFDCWQLLVEGRQTMSIKMAQPPQRRCHQEAMDKWGRMDFGISGQGVRSQVVKNISILAWKNRQHYQKSLELQNEAKEKWPWGANTFPFELSWSWKWCLHVFARARTDFHHQKEQKPFGFMGQRRNQSQWVPSSMSTSFDWFLPTAKFHRWQWNWPSFWYESRGSVKWREQLIIESEYIYQISKIVYSIVKNIIEKYIIPYRVLR